MPSLRNSNDIIFNPNIGFLYSDWNTIYLTDNQHQVKYLLNTGNDIKGLAFLNSTQEIFYSEGSNKKIIKINLDGTNKTQVLTLSSGLAVLGGIDIDEINGKIYWANTGQSKIQRSNLDGSSIEDVITGIDEVVNILIAPEINTLFYSAKTRIGSTQLDGSNNQVLLNKDLVLANFMQFDSKTNILYWSDGLKGTLEQLNVQDNKRSGLITNYNNIRFNNLDFDGLNNLMFVRSDQNIIKLNSNGAYAQKYKVGNEFNNNPPIQCDIINKKIYFTSDGKGILETDYDGSYSKVIASPDFSISSNISDYSLDGRKQLLYFSANDSIYCLNLNTLELIAKKILQGSSISVFDIDFVNQKIYYSPAEGKIYKMELDGSNPELLSNSRPTAILVSPKEEALFFVRNSDIFKSDLEGNNEELYLSGITAHSLVSSAEKAYLQLPITKLTNSTDNNKVKINWTLESSFNGLSPNKIGEFTIEKLMNNNWQSIGNLDYFDTQVNYEFIDNNPSKGKNIYRIIHISSKNKLLSLSQRINVDFVSSLEIENNNFSSQIIYISNNSIHFRSNLQNLNIQSLDGKLVFKLKNAKSDSSLKLPIELHGIYVASFEINGVKKTQKLVF